jgi:hypothetical protein
MLNYYTYSLEALSATVNASHVHIGPSRSEMRDIPTSKRPLERPLQEQRPRDHQHNNEYQPRVTVQDTQNIDQHNDFEREKTRKRSGSRKKSVTYSSSEDSRTSDSDSDDSSASDADSFADSKLRNALKSQGQVHDLMLKASNNSCMPCEF